MSELAGEGYISGVALEMVGGAVAGDLVAGGWLIVGGPGGWQERSAFRAFTCQGGIEEKCIFQLSIINWGRGPKKLYYCRKNCLSLINSQPGGGGIIWGLCESPTFSMTLPQPWPY